MACLCEAVDDKVGAAVSMTYVTGQPLLFVGTGQVSSSSFSLITVCERERERG